MKRPFNTRARLRAVATGLVLVCAVSAAASATFARSGLPPAVGAPGRGLSERCWGTCATGVSAPARTWYFAEGCTDGGFETWILVQNPSGSPVDVEMELQTGSGMVPGPRTTVPPASRRSYDLSAYVVSYEVAATVTASADVVCERAMYGGGREWGTCTAGVNAPAATWYMAEGCTDGGLETWVLVANPSGQPVDVSMELQTDKGLLPGPRDTVGPWTRRTYDLADYAVAYDVSTKVSASGAVVCERAMYGGDREWGTCAAGVTAPAGAWYLAEGCTLGGFETWVLVQNPASEPVGIDIRLQTDGGEVPGPRETVPARSRRSYDLARFAPGRSLSAVVSAGGPVVAERAVYGDGRLWGTCAAGCAALSEVWYLAEGCTGQGFETWLAVQNPGMEPVNVHLTLQTENGEVPGPSATVPPGARSTFDLGAFVTSYDVSAVVRADGPVACERAVYGEGTNRRLRAPVDGPLLYPFTADASIACGRWPAGSLDYPYFGAPRANTRLHAGIDIYPAAGEGAPVSAVKAGTVVRTGLFYTRYTGEQTFAVLVDHGDFVANYAELRPLEPWVCPGARLSRGQPFGRVSGTVQLHFEMYAPGTTAWLSWYGPQPANLIDPTLTVMGLY